MSRRLPGVEGRLCLGASRASRGVLTMVSIVFRVRIRYNFGVFGLRNYRPKERLYKKPLASDRDALHVAAHALEASAFSRTAQVPLDRFFFSVCRTLSSGFCRFAYRSVELQTKRKII